MHKEHSTMAKIVTTNLLELHYEAIKYYTNFQYEPVKELSDAITSQTNRVIF